MKKEASLSIVYDQENKKYLMIKHHRGINNGYLNFPGGKKEADETMLQCVIRETLEETGILINNPKEVGYIEFPTMNFYVYVYMSTEFSGELIVNQEEVETFWQDENNIPYDKMREADKDFIPLILSGKYVKKAYFYNKDFNIEKIVNL
ncbi:MAG: NUDIX domain-containing protein [Alphaproteobacteria bacterium]